MSALSFGLDTANDALISITCPGIKAISLSGRELRRAKRQAIKQPKGF